MSNKNFTPIETLFHIKPHFNLNEFFIGCTQYERENIPFIVYSNILKLSCMLEQIRRDLCGALNTDIPIHITSGYRNVAHNKRVGGNIHSQHLDGSAVDITCEYMDVLKIIITKYSTFGQCIIYKNKNFIHLSLPTSKHHNHIIEF